MAPLSRPRPVRARLPLQRLRGQEPGPELEIAAFCRSTYAVDFPMFAKITVKGPDKHPLYRALLDLPGPAGGRAGEISWNFEKFVVGRDGSVAARFEPRVTPEDPNVVRAIEAELAK